MKMIHGSYRPDSGSVAVDGNFLEPGSTAAARAETPSAASGATHS